MLLVLTWYSLLNPAHSLEDMFAIWALMFLTDMCLFTGGPFFVFSREISAYSMVSFGWSCWSASSELKINVSFYAFCNNINKVPLLFLPISPFSNFTLKKNVTTLDIRRHVYRANFVSPRSNKFRNWLNKFIFDYAPFCAILRLEINLLFQ